MDWCIFSYVSNQEHQTWYLLSMKQLDKFYKNQEWERLQGYDYVEVVLVCKGMRDLCPWPHEYCRPGTIWITPTGNCVRMAANVHHTMAHFNCGRMACHGTDTQANVATMALRLEKTHTHTGVFTDNFLSDLYVPALDLKFRKFAYREYISQLLFLNLTKPNLEFHEFNIMIFWCK